MWHRLAHRVGRFVASADRRRGQVSQRLEHKISDSPTRPEQFDALIQAEMKRWSRVIVEAKIEME